MKKCAVFFDLDGTLFDTRPDIVDAYLATFRAFGAAVDPAAFRIGPPMAECIRLAMPDADPARRDAVAAAFVARYDGGGFPQTRPYPGVEALLDRLAARGVPLYIATNKRLEPARRILEKFDWRRRFTGIYTTDLLRPERTLSKVAMLTLAAGRDGLDPAVCAMVGDTAGDVIAGRAAGMRTVGVAWGYAAAGELENAAPDALVERPEAADGAIFPA